ncbi:uncharacterized protein L201_000085 [Kwoniella dendrophila CBS 6074]|uniref:F-box domain-containing protein n=1 Tax=Kwoniella dendrophila CBS 6074 TaxID=1295534 RepID=A0AAX4JIC5_9TREE
MSTSKNNTASCRIANHLDILINIFGFLPSKDLFATCRTNKIFYSISISFLYQHIIVKPSPLSTPLSTSSARTVHSGSQSKKSDSEEVSKIYRHPFAAQNKDQSLVPKEYRKSTLIESVHRIDIHVHRDDQCPSKTFSGIIPDLKTLHIAGGKKPIIKHNNTYIGHQTYRHRQDILDIDDDICQYGEENDYNTYCDPWDCPFILNSCSNAQRIIIRDLNFIPLKNMSKLNEVVLKLRPCQLPHFGLDYDQEGRRKPSPKKNTNDPIFYYHMMNDDESLISSLSKNVEKLKLIWWDERHSFRIDWQELGYPQTSRKCGTGRQKNNSSQAERERRRDDKKMLKSKQCKGCEGNEYNGGYTYYFNHFGYHSSKLDESSRSPNLIKTRLVDLFYMLGEKTSLREINIYNFEKTAEMTLSEMMITNSNKEKSTVQGLRDELVRYFNRGRDNKNNDAGNIGAPSNCHINYHTINEYYPHSFKIQ